MRSAAVAPKRATPAKAAKAAKEGESTSALSVDQLVALKDALGFADYRAMADALGLSEVSVKRMMTSKQSVTKQVAFVLLALRYFRDHPRAALQFDQFLMTYNKELPQVS
ncbi:hypothetical protein [Cupriavidus sp. TMH.W2]|uniref:hypothetical protein n=1 Tax=Cupriavidus sp. TMH.W2 TaxID=3434465 RepID=UPI003D77AE4F